MSVGINIHPQTFLLPLHVISRVILKMYLLWRTETLSNKGENKLRNVVIPVRDSSAPDLMYYFYMKMKP